jgi:hypothetical protein
MSKYSKSSINGEQSVDTGSRSNNASEMAASSTAPSPFGRNFFLCGFVYLVYFMSMSIIGQFLSLFYQSKGFDGKDLGMLTSIVPLTSFLLTPVWSRVMNREKESSLQQTSTSTTTPFALLYGTIVLSVVFQISLAVLDNPFSMMVAKILTGIFHAPVKPMLDALIVGHVDKQVFGKVRLFGVLGSGIGSYFGGKILQYAPTEMKEMVPSLSFWRYYWTGFNLLFLAHAVLTIPTVVGIRMLQHVEGTPALTITDEGPSSSSPAKSVTESPTSRAMRPSRSVASYIFENPDHWLFFLIIYIIGVSGGVSDAFTYVRFREVGCDTNHMGISRMLCSIGGAVMFWFSGRLTKGLGRENVLLLSLMSVGVRFSLLCAMEGPLKGYVAETIRGSIFGAFWSTATIYASEMAPPSLRAVMLLVLNSVYNGFGRSTGSLIGGRIQAAIGTEKLFWSCAAANLSFALMMFLYYHAIRPLLQKKIHKI